MPASFVFRTNQGKAYTADTYFIFGKPAPVTINSVVASASPNKYPYTVADISGTSVTNGINYNVLSFTSVSATTSYTVNYTCAFSTTIYVLAIGGGGSGGTGQGSGGGAGGVVMNPVILPVGSNTITISIGSGGASQTANSSIGNTGSNTTVTFNANTASNIIAWGGGAGTYGSGSSTPGGNGGSGGGGTYNGSSLLAAGTPNNTYNNFGNSGGTGNSASTGWEGGGGGAGTQGGNISSSPAGNGGSGIQCFLPGITSFSPSGTSYGSYYWGGGGAGSTGGYNGGIGGGGGSNGGSGGGTALNSGGGSVQNSAGATAAGAGGANTGGGGGGAYSSGYSGAGGSGIVIIAFPTTTAVSSIQYAVLPASIVSNSIYSAVLNNASLSSLAYNTIKGAFACRLLNYNYFGPIMTLRHSADTYGNNTQNFYADVFGNLGTSYLGTGTSVSAWLTANSANTTYAYVTKWYGQGMDASFNSGTQYTTTNQPIYDVANGLINFGYTGAGGGVVSPISNNSYFNMPNSTFSIGDNSYNITSKMRNYGGYGTIMSQGTTVSNHLTNPFIFNGKYCMSHFGTDFTTTTAPVVNDVVTYNYTGNNGLQTLYVNGSSVATYSSGSALAVDGTNSYIANSNNATASSSSIQMYYLYTFNSCLTNQDRQIVEATPYQYSASATTAIAGLSATNITSTNFSLSWTALASPNYYILWINGSMFGSYTAGSAGTFTTTITPGVSGPWTVNLYAYNSSNVLLASGTLSGVFYQMLPFTTINSTSVTVPSQFIGLSNTTYGGMSNTAVAVNWTQSKLLFIGSKGIFYSTSSDGGTTWTALTSLSTTNYGQSSISMSADGTQAVFGSYALSRSGYILWTGATPSAPVTLDSTVGYWYTSMTPDGSKACFGGITNYIYYATWNGSAYTWGGLLGSLQIQSGVAISPDGSVVIGSNRSNTLFYATITWAGNTPTVSGATTLSQSGDQRGLAFLGGGYSGPPTNIILQSSAGYGSFKILIASWNNTAKTVGTFTTNTTMMNSQSTIDSVTTGNDGSDAFTPCGPNGNVIYYLQNVSNTPTSTSFNIGKATLNVT